MFNLNSCIEVFGVQVEPQLSVLFAAINKAVESLCQFTFFDLRYNDISCLVPFWCRLWGWLSHASFGILTDHVLFVFFIGYFLKAVSLQGVVTFSWIVKLHIWMASSQWKTGDLYGWAEIFCDIEGYSSAFPFVGTSCSNGTAIRDLWAAVDSEGNIWV